MSDFRKLTERVYVAPQLSKEDFAQAAALGVRHVINNRPDGEAPDQLQSEEARAAAEAAGLSYHYAPFQGQPTAQALETLSGLLAADDAPILAYCRSGTRSSTVWAMAAAKAHAMTADEIVATARAAGYDFSQLRGLFETLANE